MESTTHWETRHSRYDFIKNKIGIGFPIRMFILDKGHPDGPEIHTLTNTGIVIVRNALTDKLITTLIARPTQIHRYYNSVGEQAPDYIIEIAIKHTLAGYHHK